MCHVLWFHVSHIIYHLSLTPTATAADTQPDNSPIIHRKLVCNVPTTKNISKHEKSFREKNVQRYANISNRVFKKKSPVHRENSLPRWHTQTHNCRTSRLSNYRCLSVQTMTHHCCTHVTVHFKMLKPKPFIVPIIAFIVMVFRKRKTHRWLTSQIIKISRIRETPTLSTDAYSRTNTNLKRLRDFFFLR